MSNERPWYREPETFIALAALVVSLTAVIVGIYEASLQRAHDRAEVWPRLEVSTWTSDTAGASLRVDNTGLGPALVNYVSVSVDGRLQSNWPSVLKAAFGDSVPASGHSTVLGHALRPGDQHTMVHISASSLPSNFWDSVGRITVRVCYSSVFGDSWMVSDTLGKSSKWTTIGKCPAQAAGTDL